MKQKYGKPKNVSNENLFFFCVCVCVKLYKFKPTLLRLEKNEHQKKKTPNPRPPTRQEDCSQVVRLLLEAGSPVEVLDAQRRWGEVMGF